MDYIKEALFSILSVEEHEAIYQTFEDSLALSQTTEEEMIAMGIKKSLAKKVHKLFRFKQATYTLNTLQIKQSSDVYNEMKWMAELDHEKFYVLMLSQANRVKHKFKVSKGGSAGTVVDVKLILKEALVRKANAMILVHNHPSGNLQPSQADIAITKKIKEAAKNMDISLLDHVIIAGGSFTSLADDGLM